MKIIFSDFDGTIFNQKGEVSKQDIETLERLRKSGIITAIATGRSIYSARKEIADDFPVDYLIFSSGAGIMDWRRQEIIYEQHLNREDVDKTLALLREYHLDFMVHKAIPDNHEFYYEKNSEKNLDFLRRIKIYNQYAEPLIDDSLLCKTCQILAVLPPKNVHLFDQLKAKIDHAKVIRATSPLDKQSIWLEVFPEHVDKGLTAQWLCDKLAVNSADTVSIGNDFNDVDLLNWTGKSFVVEEAPEPLKSIYPVIGSNLDSPLTKVVEQIL